MTVTLFVPLVRKILTEEPSMVVNVDGVTMVMPLKTGVGHATEKSKRKPRPLMTDDVINVTKICPDAATRPVDDGRKLPVNELICVAALLLPS